MKTLILCPTCQQPLPADAPGRLCPACLLASVPSGPSAPPGARPQSRPVAGSDFGPYQIVRLLGRGGMGMVFEAELRGSGRRVALKVMSHGLTSEADRKRFLREGRLAAAVNHPNVVYVHGSYEIEGMPVIAMELVAGGTLQDQLYQSGTLTAQAATEAGLQMIAGLEAAEAAGVLHRDIKPANCFVGADGMVKIGDFGLSVSTFARGESLLTNCGGNHSTCGRTSIPWAQRCSISSRGRRRLPPTILCG